MQIFYLSNCNVCTVFENHRKSLIQHCVDKKFIKKCQKWSIMASFWKAKACGQTVLPDRLVLIGQKLVENAKLKKFKCEILSNFQSMCMCCLVGKTVFKMVLRPKWLMTVENQWSLFFWFFIQFDTITFDETDKKGGEGRSFSTDHRPNVTLADTLG